MDVYGMIRLDKIQKRKFKSKADSKSEKQTVKKIDEKRVEKNRGTIGSRPKKKWMEVIKEDIKA